MCLINSFYIGRFRTKIKDKEKLWQDVLESNPVLYQKVRKSLLGRTMNLPGKVGRKCSVIGYALAQKIFGFN